MKKLFTFALALLGFAGVAKAASVDDLPVCKHSYVLVGDDWTNNGTEKIAKSAFFGNGFFFTPTGHDKATNKGSIDLSTVDELGIVTQEIVDKYAEYGSHLNSLRLKAAQDVMAMKVTAKSKLIIFYEKNKETDNRYPIISKTADMKDPLSGEEDVQVKGAYGSKQCGRLEWTAPDDGLIYIGAENQIFISYIIVEANEAPGTPSVKIGEQTYENGLWFREVTCKAVPATEEGSDEKIATVVTYTTNGSDPTASSELYTGPIKCYEDMTVRFQAFYDFTNGGKADDENFIDGADNEAIVTFQFDAPTITAEGGKVTITSPYEGAKNYATTDGDLENAEEKSELTLSESATVTAFSKIVNGSYTTFTSKTASKDVYVLDPIKEKKIVTVTDGEVVVDEEATAQDPNGETIYMVKNGVISADKKDFFVKDLAYGVIKDAAYQIDSKEMYIKMSTTNITFQVAEGDSVTVKVICSKNSCKNLDAEDAAEDKLDNGCTPDRQCYVNVSGTNYCLTDADGNHTNDLKLYPEANEFEFGLPAGTWTFQKYSGTGNILISSIEIAPAAESAEDAPELQAPEGWTKGISNGNLAGEDVKNYWSKEAPSTAIVGATIVDGAGKDGSRGIVVKSQDKVSQAWDTQFWIKVDEQLPAGTKIHVEFDYKADKAGSNGTQCHGEPGGYLHWAAIGNVAFTEEWQHFSSDFEVANEANNMQSIAFNLNDIAEANTYYFDNFGVWYQKPKPVAEWKDLMVNGDMEGDDSRCFYVTEQGVGGPFVAKITKGIGKDGGNAIKVQSADEPANDWATQFFIRLPYQLPAGTKFRLSFDHKASVEGGSDTQCHAEPGQYIHYACAGSPTSTTEWQTYTYEGTIPSQCDGSAGDGFDKIFQTIAFNLAKNKVATEFIFDNVKFEVEKSVADGLQYNPAVNPTPYPSDAPELQAPEGWTKGITNGNLAGTDVSSFFAKEAPSTEIVNATIVDEAGKDGSRGIVVKSQDKVSQAWDTQFWIKVDEQLPAGTKIHVEFDYKADKAGSNGTQCHGEPGGYLHWAAIGNVAFTEEWQHFSSDFEVANEANNMQSIAFNLNDIAEANTYYFDNFGVWYQKPAPVSDWADLIVNGDMEGDDMQCFYATEQGVGGPFVASTTPGIGKDGGKAIKVQSADSPANDWATQFFIRVPYQVPAGTKFRLSFDYKADVAGDADTQCHAEPGQYIHYTCAGSPNFTTEWQSYEYEGTIPSQCDGSLADDGFEKIFQTIAFNLAKNKVATGFIFDNVKFEVPTSVAESLKLNPSGIEIVRITETQNNVRYNLSGVRVNENYKGIVIMNGKKIIQK